MSENKFIAKLKGEPTPKSVVEIQNDRLVAPFKSSPMGHIADRDSSVVVAKGAQNWAVNQGQLVPVADDYVGTESNLTATSRVSGAGLWLNATYTFPATGDETNPVSAIIAPSAKWVLTLCGDSLITQNGSVITLTMLVKIGATHLTTKQFKVRECASQFSQRMAIDFSESEQKVIKAHGGSPLTVQVLCDDEGASATIYSGMTHLTLLQRKIDAELVATDNVLLPEFIENLLEGYIIPADYFSNYEYLEQVEDGGGAFPQFTRSGDDMNFSGWLDISSIKNDLDELGDQVSGIEEKIPGDASATNKLATKADLKDIDLDGYVKKSGDTMTGDLGIVSDTYKTSANISVEGARGRTTIRVSDSEEPGVYSQFELNRSGTFVARTISGTSINYGQVGAPDVPMYNVYTKRLNNGADLAIPTEGGTLARLEDVANKQDKLTAGDNIVISGNTISATGAGGGAGLDMQVVDQLPETGQKGIIYLVKKDGAAPDIHDEYVWIESTQSFELIGTTQVDLTDYAKKEELDNYLSLSGGTMTGGIAFTGSGSGTNAAPAILDQYGNALIRVGSRGLLVLGCSSQYVRLISTLVPSGSGVSLGDPTGVFDGVYTRVISSSNYANRLLVPAEGGTLARIEDINAIGGDGTAGQVLTKTDDGMAWQDATGGGGDALPDQTGNAEKVLTTDGTNASWTEMPGLIIRRL